MSDQTNPDRPQVAPETPAGAPDREEGGTRGGEPTEGRGVGGDGASAPEAQATDQGAGGKGAKGAGKGKPKGARKGRGRAPRSQPARARNGLRLWRRGFLAALERTGSIVSAARAAGVNSTTPYRSQDKDSMFAAQVREARAVFLANYETAVDQRALAGIQGPNGKFLVPPSDRLAELRLKRLDPAYRDRQEGAAGSGVVVHISYPGVPHDGRLVPAACIPEGRRAAAEVIDTPALPVPTTQDDPERKR